MAGLLCSDVYHVLSAALFLLDNHSEVYLWQGYFPSESSEGEENVVTGSADARFNINKELALQTTIAYCDGKLREMEVHR